MDNIYFSLNEYCRKTFGHKLYKLSVDGGMTCPNRDGKISSGGCIFCSEKGSGEFSEKQCGSVTEQLENAKRKVQHKNKNGKYIAYFQSFTNTYAPVEYLERIFTEAVSFPDVEVLSIATRPDCLGKDVLNLLERLNKIKPIWVELGFQTANEETAVRINRGYKNKVYDEAVENLHGIGVQVVTHVILGLPGESEKDMISTVKYVCNKKTDGIKLHMLYVQSDAPLAEDWKNGKFRCMEKEEYISLLLELVSIIPKDIVIHRLTGDGDKKTLLAPMWSADKKRVLNDINKAFLSDS